VCTGEVRLIASSSESAPIAVQFSQHSLPLSNFLASVTVRVCEAKLTIYPGAIEAFDRAIAADLGFALAHAAKAHAQLERGDAAAARASRPKPSLEPPCAPRLTLPDAIFAEHNATTSRGKLARDALEKN
jgi:hypothetical protein